VSQGWRQQVAYNNRKQKSHCVDGPLDDAICFALQVARKIAPCNMALNAVFFIHLIISYKTVIWI
jgi:hypothetical protein